MSKLLKSPDEPGGRNLPAAAPSYPAPAGAGPWTQPWYGPEAEPEEPSLPLSHYLWILKRHRWKLLAFVTACVISTLVVSSRLTPIYESTATVDVDRRMPTGILGQEALQAPATDADQFLATQIKLIQSDSVLRPVVQHFKLAADQLESAGPANAAETEDAPVRLKHLKVTRPPNTYLLLIGFRSPDSRLAADVANAVAKSYIEHTYNIRYRSSASLSSFMEKQLEELRAKMERSSAALAQFERELNVINPEEKTSILSARLLQLNAEYTSAQSDRVRKEAAWRSVEGGSLEAAQISTQGEALKKLAERIDESREKFAQVKAHYGANHPEYRKAAAQLAELEQLFDAARRSIARRVALEYSQALNRETMLKKAVAEIKAEFDRINARSFEYQALKRDAEADKKLYQELVTRIREAGINAGFQSNAIRLADPARPAVRPVFPNLKLNLALALLFSTLLGIGAAILSDVLDNTIRDPEQVRRTLNTEVVGSLPLVKSWRNKPALAAGRPGERSQALVPIAESADRTVTGFEEAVRTLRNAILLGQFDRPLKSILVTSATPGEGKTTTALHLAIAHAEQKHKTLLIDADLRRPSIQRALGLVAAAGLSTALSNGLEWKDKLLQLDHLPDLDILASGPAARRSFNLVGRGLPQILEQAEQDYDLVVVDAPPLLGFSEPLQIASAVDGVVVVSLAGKTDRKAVGSVLNTLKRLHANVVGLVLNEVTHELSDSYHYYGYGKYYKYYRHEEGERN